MTWSVRTCAVFFLESAKTVALLRLIVMLRALLSVESDMPEEKNFLWSCF